MSVGERAVVECSEVGFVYPPPHRVSALRGVNLKVRTGESLALCGPSGSGKSTLLAVLGMLDVPTSGEYRFGGRSAIEMGPGERSRVRAREIGFVFQSFHLMPGRDVIDNVAASLLYVESSHWRRERRARECIGLVGLGHRSRHLPHELSGGERQRVAIARALAARPALILADEPTGNLDVATGEAILSLLREASWAGLVIATHDANAAESQDRVVVLRDGTVISRD